MDWLRSTIGIADSAAPKKRTTATSHAIMERHRKESATKSYDDRADALIRAQALKIQMKEMQLEEVTEQCKQALKEHRDMDAKRYMMQKKQLMQELNTMRAKHNNLSQTGSKIADANQNLAQALLVKDGADELEGAVEAMNEINLDEAVDRLQDNVGMVQEHDDRLSEPIFSSGVLIDEYEVDEELERMMRERNEAEAAKYDLPNVSTHPHPPAGKPTAVEIDGISN